MKELYFNRKYELYHINDDQVSKETYLAVEEMKQQLSKAQVDLELAVEMIMDHCKYSGDGHYELGTKALVLKQIKENEDE